MEDEKWKRVSSMRPGTNKFNDFLALVEEASAEGEASSRGSSRKASTPSSSFSFYNAAAEAETPVEKPRKERPKESESTTARPRRKSIVQQRVEELTRRGEASREEKSKSKRLSSVSQKLSSFRKSMSRRSSNPREKSETESTMEDREEETKESSASGKDEDTQNEERQGRPRRRSLVQERVEEITRRSLSRSRKDSESTAPSRSVSRERRKSIVQERIATFSRRKGSRLGSFYSFGENSEPGEELDAFETPKSKPSLTRRFQRAASKMMGGGSSFSSGASGSTEGQALIEEADNVEQLEEQVQVEVEQEKPKKKGGNLGSLVSLFSSGKVSNVEKKQQNRESIERLKKEGVRTWTRPKSGVQMHAMSNPSDELKWVLQKDDGEVEGEDASQVRRSVAFEPEEEPDEDEKARRRTKRLEKLKSIRFSVAPEKCALCNKTVYRMEKLTDSQDRPFHWTCLKCADCLGVKSLAGEQVHICEETNEDEDGEESSSPPKKFVLCHTHFGLRRSAGHNIVKGWRPDTSHINHGGKYENDIEGARRSVRKSLQMTMGRKPLCSRCGGEINMKDKDFIVSGMERFHVKCPDKSTIKHTPRHYALGVPDRFPVLFCTDPVSKRAFSFLFKLDIESKEAALSQHRLQPVRLRYVPDSDAYTASRRQISTKNEHFQVFDQKKRYEEIRHPVTNADGYTRYDAKNGVVIAQLYRVEGGVVHGLHCALGYDYDEKNKVATVEAIALELTFELLSQDDYVSPLKGGEADAPPSLVLENDFVKRFLSA